MLQSTLLKIRKILKEKTNLKEEKIELILSILKLYNAKDIIYPGVFIRKLNLSMKEIYTILEVIRDDGYLSLGYEVYCFSCNRFTGEVYQTINSMPEEFFCEECGEELEPLENSIAIYKVKND